MKMNRWIKAAVVASLAITLMAGCSSQKEEKKEETKVEEIAKKEAVAYKDGTYKASYKDFDDRGWKAFVEITVKDQKIEQAKFDYVNKDQKLKSEDEEYAKAYKKETKITPKEAADAMVKALIEKQDANIDSVAGATHSTENFKALSTKALENAETGKQEEAIIE